MPAPSRKVLLEWMRPTLPTPEELEAEARLERGLYEIALARLDSILEEARDVFVRTGVSSMLRSGDLVVGIYTAAGDMVAANCGVYLHAAVGQLPVKYVLHHFGGDPTLGIEPGDIFYVNDPAYGGIHNPDQMAMMPVFIGDELFAWVVAAVHQPETGAIEPGGMPVTARSRHHEGMHLAPFKLGSNYRLRSDLLELMTNFISRAPRMQEIDVRSRVTTCDRIRRRLEELVANMGKEVIRGVFRRSISVAERGAREKIARWNDGIVRAVAFIDTVGYAPGLLRTSLTVTKRGDRITFDFSGSSPEHDGAFNSFAHIVAAHTAIYMYAYAFSDLPISSGTYAPLEFIIPEGTFLNASPDAAVSCSPITNSSVMTLMPIVMSKLMYGSPDQDKVCASAGNVGSGYMFATLNYWGVPVADICGFPLNAEGGGARPDLDGVDAYGFPWAHYGKTPDAEEFEKEYPFLHLAQKLLPDSGGAGKRRGGAGTQTLFVVRGPNTILNAHPKGSKVPIGQGLFGGYAPSTNPGVQVTNSNLLAKWAAGDPDVPTDIIELVERRPIQGDYQFEHGVRPSRSYAEGDIYVALTSGGGGYGDPLDREPELVARDVRSGLVSRWAAEHVYGVMLDEHGEALSAETKAKRHALRERRLANGRPYQEFLAEWATLRPAEEALRFFGSWPEGRPLAPVIRP